MSSALLEVLCPLAGMAGVALVTWMQAWREQSRFERLRAEDRRRVGGLPQHERCSCDECAAWRRKEFGA